MMALTKYRGVIFISCSPVHVVTFEGGSSKGLLAAHGVINGSPSHNWLADTSDFHVDLDAVASIVILC